MSTRPVRWLLVTAILLTSAASACGGDGEQASPIPETTPPDFPTIIEPPKKAMLSVTVQRVVDVRTVQLSDGEEIKVKGLAAPDECWAEASTTFAKTMLLDKQVDTTPAGSLRMADGTDYAVLAIELGMARSETADDKLLTEAETTASTKKLGRWGPPCVKPNADAPPPAPADSPKPTTPAPAPVLGCSVAYKVTQRWQGGYRADVTIRNTGNTATNGWTLQWSFPTGQTVREMWNATSKQSGKDVSATAVSYNQVIPPGESVLMGFTATDDPYGGGMYGGGMYGSPYGPGFNTDPRAFSLSGTSCTLA